MPVIPAPAPTLVPAVPEKLYNRLKLIEVRIRDDSRDDPNGPILAVLRFWKALVNDADAWELSPKAEDLVPTTLAIDDLLAEAAQRAGDGKPKLYLALTAVMDFVEEYAIEKLTPTPP